TSGPTVEIMSHEQELSPYFSPSFIKRVNLQQIQVAGAQPAQRFNLDVGTPRYLGFLINTTNTATGVDLPGALTNVKMVTGSTYFFDIAEPTLLQWQRTRLGLPPFIDKTPNVGTAPLADAFGVTSGAIVDAGAAFAQAT